MAEGEIRLWSLEGVEALAYLRNRGLADATIRAARLGYLLDNREKKIPRGVAIPWGEPGAFRMVNVRRPEGSHPKYLGLEGSRREGLYPGIATVRPGFLIAIVERELDALLLGQDLMG